MAGLLPGETTCYNPPMTKDRAWTFIIVVLAASWLVQYVIFSGLVPAAYLTLYMFVPALVAFGFFLAGKEPWKKQAALFTSRTDLWSWAFAVVYPLLWMAGTVLLALVLGIGKFNPGSLTVVLRWPFLAGFTGMVLIMAPVVFGEEYGWRGYLLPALAERYGKVRATVILGLVWGLWHIPSYYFIYSAAGLGNPLLLTTLGVFFVAVGAFPYSYVFFRNGNVLPSVLLHAVYDKAMAVAFLSVAGNTAPNAGPPGLITVPWPYVLGLVIVTGAAAAVVFSRALITAARPARPAGS
jgi:membrane protease YdiL (CAAX protease family)